MSVVLDRDDDGFSIDAGLLATLLGVAPSEVQGLMRAGAITSICERGEGEHDGLHRLTFFYRGRRVRLEVDGAGRGLRRSKVDLGDRPPPRRARAMGP